LKIKVKIMYVCQKIMFLDKMFTDYKLKLDIDINEVEIYREKQSKDLYLSFNVYDRADIDYMYVFKEGLITGTNLLFTNILSEMYLKYYLRNSPSLYYYLKDKEINDKVKLNHCFNNLEKNGWNINFK